MLGLHVFPDVEEAPDDVCVADLAAVVPVRLPLQPIPGTGTALIRYRTAPISSIWIS